MIEKPTLKLAIKKQVIEEHLRFLYGTKKGAIAITRQNDVGRYMFNLVNYSPFPVKQKCGDDEPYVDIILPSNHYSDLKYCYWTREDMEKINEHIQVDFNIFFRGYMFAGEQIGVQQKDLLEAFMAYTGISDVGKNFDTLKKKDYRHRLKIAEILNFSLEKLGYQTHTKKMSDLSLAGDKQY